MTDDESFRRFQRRMQAIPKSVREAVQPALAKGAAEIAAAAASLAPVDDGDLRDSIAVTLPGRVTPGGVALPENVAAVGAGSNAVPHARWVEFGTTKMAAKPFFWPAFRSLRKRAAGRVKRAMSKAIREARG